ncbi:hypothetical protein TRFO_25168 [Tritrichomonas foetus]|uniref:MRH domain-containing protein n=1 Tax=Tritrichomonas foetus TaxID=1144522 RepID=A0A1J4K6A4_9EUKA|nr:hypothetical protein TRFO_25168 [Tritrichomonas foetus]|eukprot:OHT06707.1 hypothetical protein TRFO_25168 [Tritrichomonas foetus]
MNLLVLFVSLSFSVSIERFPCAANINGYLFNITELANGRKNGFDIIKRTDDDRYYFKMCGELPHDELPPLAPDSTDISVMRCNYSSHECASAIPVQSFDWKLLDQDNPNEGVIYHASGEPFVDPEDRQYYTIDFEIMLYCDKSETKPDTNYTYLVYNNTNEVVVRVIFFTAFACPVKKPSPSPTPNFAPDCEFEYYMSSVSHYGVYTDFKIFNDGPYGIRVPLTINKSEKTMFYQPCERMLCPFNYTCTDSGYSSAWLCDPVTRSCDNYGLISPDGIDAEIQHILVKDSPIVIRHQNENAKRNMTLTVSCNKLYEYDHFKFDKEATITDGSLKVTASAADSCYKQNPAPVPPFSDDICYAPLTYFGNVNMSTFNNNPDGHIAQVNDGYTLYYQPCGGMKCPNGAQCDGDNNATVWLCQNESYLDCIAYGLLENNLSYSENVREFIVTYTGDRKRMTTVEYKCDESLKENEIKMPSVVTLFGTRLRFSVHSKNFCSRRNGSSVTGGAIFLIVLFMGIILYLAFALIVGYVKNGRIGLPNTEFWTEFFACVSTGFMFIVKCGHMDVGKTKYDEI